MDINKTKMSSYYFFQILALNFSINDNCIIDYTFKSLHYIAKEEKSPEPPSPKIFHIIKLTQIQLKYRDQQREK